MSSRFLYELSQIPDFAGRACSMIFHSTFTDVISSIKHKLSSVSYVCKVGTWKKPWWAARNTSLQIASSHIKVLCFKGSAGEQRCQGVDGTGTSPGEPHERRQQDQRPGRRLCTGNPPKAERCQKQGECWHLKMNYNFFSPPQFIYFTMNCKI